MNGSSHAQILEYIEANTALTLAHFRQSFLHRRISKRITMTNCRDEAEYLELLKQGDDEINALLNELTIQVSWFYRNPITWEILRSKVLPELLAQKSKRNEKLIRIWCAGCARGEEAYTIAILLREFIEKEKVPVQIQIFATDIDIPSLKKAKSGSYDFEAVRHLPHGLVSKYLTKTNEVYKISQAVKSDVHFSCFDLLDARHSAPSESVYANFDITLCRNVLIYYQEDIQAQLYSKLTKATARQGYLVIGESEVPVGPDKRQVIKIAPLGNIYQKL